MKNIIIAGIILLVFTAQWSCKKTGPAEAVITVQDSLGAPVAGAKVVLRQDSVVNPNTGVRADIYQEAVTSSGGQAFFKFELEAVLNIEVSKDSITENDEYIRLEQNKTVNKIVVLD
jgi:hypothetical protein